MTDNKLVLQVWSNGDPSVGIAGENAEVSIMMPTLTVDEEKAFVDHAKEVLGKAFSELWGEKVCVMTQEEVSVEGEPFDGC